MAEARWFSENEDKAWAEKFFLIYSPFWMALMGLAMLFRWDKNLGDVGLLFHACLVALPLFLVPLFLRRGSSPEGGWRNSYWFKANLYMFVFGFFGNYFGSEYFFDVLGMVYLYPNLDLNLDAALLGSGEQKVPLIMYFYTHAYFMTYHTSAIVVLRRVMTSGLPAKALLFLPLCLVVGYFWAWAETRAMANPMIASTFYYKNMEAMLAYGSFIYATYFIASFPVFYYLDEHQAKAWDTLKVIAAALSASMITFYLLDACAHIITSL